MEKRSSSKTGLRAPANGAAEKVKDPINVASAGSTSNGNNRSLRKREGNNTTAKPRQTQNDNRKPAAQKSNIFNKKPKARGAYTMYPGEKHSYGGSQAFSNQASPSAPSAESGSVQRPGSKKQSLNHLLNFTLAPREHSNSNRSGWKTRNNWQHRKTVKYNKEQFLQANCQFIISESGDFNHDLYHADPDLLVDWKLIELIRIYVHEIPSCPICLYPPVVAKITRCGHIYCWSCILHYLALSEKTWRKCPICYEAIHKQDLKSVIMEETTEYCINKEMTFQLMCRQKGGTIVVPVLDGNNDVELLKDQNTVKKYGESKHFDRYGKILLADASQIEELRRVERDKLTEKLANEEEESEKCFIEQALSLLSDDMSLDGMPMLAAAKTQGDLAAATQPDVPVGYNPLPTDSGEFNFGVEERDTAAGPDDVDTNIDWFDSDGEREDEIPADTLDDMEDIGECISVKEVGEDVALDIVEGASAVIEEGVVDGARSDAGENPAMTLSGDVGQKLVAGHVVSSLSTRHMHAATCKISNKHLYYFYQASDGQHIYLHALNVRCLVKEYGSLDQCPRTITANIVQLDHYSMAEDARKKLRYLSHLPLTCEFQIAELRLHPPLVSMDTLKFFYVELQKRRDERQKRKHLERKWHQHVRIEENKKVGKFPSARHNLSSDRDFPVGGGSNNSSRSISESSAPSVDDDVLVEVTQVTPQAAQAAQGGHTVADTSTQESAFPSFAQMLKYKSSAGSKSWPRLAVPGCSDDKLTSQSGGRAAMAGDDSDIDEDGERVPPPPQYNHSFSEAFQNALDNMKLNAAATSSTADATGAEAAASGNRQSEEQKRGKKGKKNKQKLLFSTSMARSK